MSLVNFEARAYSYNPTTCSQCGIVYAFVGMDKRRESGESWHCPNGHTQVQRKSDNQLLREKLELEQERVKSLNAQLDVARKQREATEKAQKRLVRRVSAGVCPHCQRTFSQLARHVACKHPEAVKP